MTDPGPRSSVTPVRPDDLPEEGTVLRPRGLPADGMGPGPGGPSAAPAAPATPGPAVDPWGATYLAPPPPGAWTPPPNPYGDSYDPDADHTVFAPNLNVPKADFGSAAVPESRFAPPEERPGVPDVAPPQERFAPKPIPGGPLDLPRGGRFAAPPEETAAARRRERRRVPGWLAGLVVLLVLGLVGAGVWWRFFRPTVIDSAITVPTSMAPSNKPKVEKPEDAVLGYLQALKAGDIAKALSYGPVGPGSQVLLTPAAVRESQARAPIDNIVVPPVSGATSSIRARYTIGTEAVDRTFNVVKTDDGGWQLAKATTTIQMTAKRSPRVPLVVNKQTVDNVAVLELVPGVYHFETGLPFLRYAATTDLKVLSLDYNEPIQVLSLELTDEGRQALLTQARASMQACLDLGSLNPPNCPFGYAQPKPVTRIRWTEKKDPWAGIQFTLTREDAAVAEANFTISLNADVDFADGQKSPSNNYEGEVRLTADITKQRAQDIQVRWSEAVR